ncbi:MAG TPA: PAS domain S-box protein, partial [Thermodesulfovibrionales bacterium]|nr:PAS domain S-box protein [Thermodesulfovibrionales bacterium]
MKTILLGEEEAWRINKLMSANDPKSRRAKSPVHDTKNKLDTLRKKAEALVRKKFGKIKPEAFSDEGIQRLIYQLQTHQIELEIQNEELRLSQLMLKESRQKYSDLYDLAPVGYFTFDINGLILEVNQTGAALLGMERLRLIKKPLTVFLSKDSQDMFFFHRKRIRETGELHTCELQLRKPKGTEVFVELRSVPTEGKRILTAMSEITERRKTDDEIIRYRESLEQMVRERTSALVASNEELEMEIVGRKRLEEKLKESEAYFRAMVENTSDIIMVLNPDATIRFSSSSVRRVLGYKPQELIGKSVFSFIHPEDTPQNLELFLSILNGGTDRHGLARVADKKGNWHTFEGMGTSLLDNPHVSGVILNAWDITAWNSAQEQLRQLTLHLISVREDERARIAREIHDELGQLLTALKLEISIISKKLRKDQEILQLKATSISQAIDDMIKTVRRISSGLRPDVLDNLGLEDAVRQEALEFQRRTGIHSSVSVEIRKEALSEHVSINVYRILQEAMTNVARHA